MHKGKPIHRAELLNESDFTVVSTYQLEYRGLVNYYRMAYNLHTLQKLKWVMEQSLAKTLAHKFKMSVRKVYKKYQTELDINGKKYKGLQVMVPREGKKPPSGYRRASGTWSQHRQQMAGCSGTS